MEQLRTSQDPDESGYLCLTLKTEQRVDIGDLGDIIVRRIRPGEVRLAFRFPRSVNIKRIKEPKPADG